MQLLQDLFKILKARALPEGLHTRPDGSIWKKTGKKWSLYKAAKKPGIKKKPVAKVKEKPKQAVKPVQKQSTVDKHSIKANEAYKRITGEDFSHESATQVDHSLLGSLHNHVAANKGKILVRDMSAIASKFGLKIKPSRKDISDTVKTVKKPKTVKDAVKKVKVKKPVELKQDDVIASGDSEPAEVPKPLNPNKQVEPEKPVKQIIDSSISDEVFDFVLNESMKNWEPIPSPVRGKTYSSTTSQHNRWSEYDKAKSTMERNLHITAANLYNSFIKPAYRKVFDKIGEDKFRRIFDLPLYSSGVSKDLELGQSSQGAAYLGSSKITGIAEINYQLENRLHYGKYSPRGHSYDKGYDKESVFADKSGRTKENLEKAQIENIKTEGIIKNTVEGHSKKLLQLVDAAETMSNYDYAKLLRGSSKGLGYEVRNGILRQLKPDLYKIIEGDNYNYRAYNLDDELERYMKIVESVRKSKLSGIIKKGSV